MQHWIRYADTTLPFTLPDGAHAYEMIPNTIEPAKNPSEKIRHALANSTGAQLSSLVNQESRVCVIVDDISRPTPAGLILQELLPMLMQHGVSKENIYFVMALGSHRKMSAAEIEHKLGPAIPKEFTVLQSAFDDPAEHLDLGTTNTGVNISVYRPVMDSTVRIGIGNIVPHNTLGWAGGSKILFPGVTSEHTVAQFHMKAMAQSKTRVFGDIDNAIRKDVEAWTEKIGLHYIINTILDTAGQICDVVAGHHVAAHRKGVAIAQTIYGVQAPAPADIVLVDSHPSDGDFWQGTKGFNAADILVKDGGAAILVAPCFEGIGPHAEYAEMIGRDDATAYLNAIMESGWGDDDPLAISVGALLSRMRQRFDMYVYSPNITDVQLRQASMQRVTDISDTLHRLNMRYGGNSTIAIVRFGAEILPLL